MQQKSINFYLKNFRKMTDKIDENKKYTAEHYLFDKPDSKLIYILM